MKFASDKVFCGRRNLHNVLHFLCTHIQHVKTNVYIKTCEKMHLQTLVKDPCWFAARKFRCFPTERTVAQFVFLLCQCVRVLGERTTL